MLRLGVNVIRLLLGLGSGLRLGLGRRFILYLELLPSTKPFAAAN